MTIHPVRKLGRIAIRRGPIAHLEEVQRAARLEGERDLRFAPTPISGGMRKALAKEQASQSALRWSARRRHGAVDFQRIYGLMAVQCPRCLFGHYFDEVDFADTIRCDRCKRPLWTS